MTTPRTRLVGLQVKLAVGLFLMSMVPLVVSVVVLDGISEVQRNYAASEAERVRQPPQEARFAVKDGALSVLREGQEGRELDQDEAMKQIQAKLVATDQRTVQLPTRVLAPSVTASAADTLTVSEQIETASTSFAGAIPEKAYNIKLAADRLNGVVVPAGGVSCPSVAGTSGWANRASVRVRE